MLLKYNTAKLQLPRKKDDNYAPLRLVYRGCEGAVKIGYRVGHRTSWMQPHYFNPRAYSVEKGKVILVVAGKGIGKTNLMRNIIQAYYRTTKNPIIVFQEKRDDLNFNRTPTLKQIREAGIERVRLAPPEGCNSPQRTLAPLSEANPGAKEKSIPLKIPLAEIDFSTISEYFGKRMSSSIAGLVLERVWQSRENHMTIHNLVEAVENEIWRFEEDPYYNTMILHVRRFIELLRMDQLLEVNRAKSVHNYIHPEQINIVDLSDLGDIDVKRFVVAQTLKMIERAYKRQECFIGITESHVYAPETGDFEAKREIIRLVTVLARSYGWTVFLETQSPDAIERILLENADEIYILGYVQRSKLTKLLRTASVNFEGFLDLFYKVTDNIPKGMGVYGSAVDPTNPYVVRIQLSPVG
jgi:DNA helicase HerA-like ATPase